MLIENMPFENGWYEVLGCVYFALLRIIHLLVVCVCGIAQCASDDQAPFYDHREIINNQSVYPLLKLKKNPMPEIPPLNEEQT